MNLKSKIRCFEEGEDFIVFEEKKEMEKENGGEKKKKKKVLVVDIKKNEVNVKYEYEESIREYRNVKVRERVGGIMMKRNLVEGKKVKEGEVMLEIDKENYKEEIEKEKVKVEKEEEK